MTTTPTADDPLDRYTDPSYARPIPTALLAARREVLAAVRDLATITDADVTRPWPWKGGSELEIRDGFYRIGEDFELAGIDAEAVIRATRVERGRAADLIAPATAARWDLQGILVQLPDAAWDGDPGGGRVERAADARPRHRWPARLRRRDRLVAGAGAPGR